MVRSFDGTFIAYQDMGAPSGEPPLLLVNGIGAGLEMWRRALYSISERRRIVTWDHRGLHSSGLPATDRLDPGAHAHDGLAVMDALGIDRFIIAAWSTGGRIALELAHSQPERVIGMATVCAGYGQRARDVVRLQPLALLPRAAGIAKHFGRPLQGVLQRFAGRPEIAGLIRQSGMTAATADTAALVEFVRGMASCDLNLLLANYQAVAGDAAPELLPDITCPVLLIAGEHDQFTPRSMTEEMAASLPDARLEIYENATHYLPIEYPDRLGQDLDEFFTSLASV
ncbi:MAG: alpha/beta fold hydrolase [Actinomycetota bacterium]